MDYYKDISRVGQPDGSFGPPTNIWKLLVEVWKMLKELLERKQS